MPRGYGRGYGRQSAPISAFPYRGRPFGSWYARPFRFDWLWILDIIVLLAMAYIVIMLFFAAAIYIAALLVLVALREGIRYYRYRRWRW
jgi:hypothetical protein